MQVDPGLWIGIQDISLLMLPQMAPTARKWQYKATSTASSRGENGFCRGPAKGRASLGQAFSSDVVDDNETKSMNSEL